MGGWLMLHAAIARPGKVAALVGVAAAADYLVTTFKKLPIEVNVVCWFLCSLKVCRAFKNFCSSNCTFPVSLSVNFLCWWRRKAANLHQSKSAKYCASSMNLV